jgi:hypothetical protein
MFLTNKEERQLDGCIFKKDEYKKRLEKSKTILQKLKSHTKFNIFTGIFFFAFLILTVFLFQPYEIIIQDIHLNSQHVNTKTSIDKEEWTKCSLEISRRTNEEKQKQYEYAINNRTNFMGYRLGERTNYAIGVCSITYPYDLVIGIIVLITCMLLIYLIFICTIQLPQYCNIIDKTLESERKIKALEEHEQLLIAQQKEKQLSELENNL